MLRLSTPPRRPSSSSALGAVLVVALAASHPAHARDVTLKVHDMAGALPDDARVEVQLLRDDGSALGARLVPRDDGAPPDAVAGDHLYTAPLAGLAADHGGISVQAAGRTWTGGFAFDASSDAVLLVGLESSGLAAASTRELSFAQGPPDFLPTGIPPALQGTEGGPAPLRNASPGGDSSSGAAGQSVAADSVHRAASWRGWALLVAGFACLSAGAWFGARHRAAA